VVLAIARHTEILTDMRQEKKISITVKWYLLVLKDLPHLEAGEREETAPKNK